MMIKTSKKYLKSIMAKCNDKAKVTHLSSLRKRQNVLEMNIIDCRLRKKKEKRREREKMGRIRT